MVGLPYPNIKSPELAEKMQYLNSTLVKMITHSTYTVYIMFVHAAFQCTLHVYSCVPYRMAPETTIFDLHYSTMLCTTHCIYCDVCSVYHSPSQPRDPEGRLPGQVHYENLCMKAVNQSIGRSIRHSRDYACIVLVDQRYSRPSVRNKLPQWISTQLVPCESFGPAFSSVRKVSFCGYLRILCKCECMVV